MKVKELICALALALLFTVTTAFAQGCYLTWDAPTTDTNGNDLLPGDIDAYRVYVVNRSTDFVKGDASQYVEILAPGDTLDPVTHIECALTPWTSGKKAVVTAVGDSGGMPSESEFSNVIMKTTPGNPTNAKQVKEPPVI